MLDLIADKYSEKKYTLMAVIMLFFMAMSLLSVGCGFSAGVFNPFTIGICQELAGLPMFSGAWIRAINFACIYALLLIFTSTRFRRQAYLT
ncbi:MAG: hypothetical protein MJ059_05700 [Lachnospiraceae bacterium]|nr:hypothetical protein [Lachnospiraceae bacterium]